MNLFVEILFRCLRYILNFQYCLSRIDVCFIKRRSEFSSCRDHCVDLIGLFSVVDVILNKLNDANNNNDDDPFQSLS